MRNLGLDLVRIIAVMLVIGRHLELPDQPHGMLRMWQQGGWIGVDLFFVLSGFLVSSLLFREHQRHGAVDTKRFLLRRAFKIYPAFWIFLSFSLATRLFFHQPPSLQQLIGELLFIQNYAGGIWEHTWTLAVEEHFYIGLALTVAWLATKRPDNPFQSIPSIFIVVATACMAGRLLNLMTFPDYSHRVYLYATHIRIDSLMFGVLLAYLCSYCDLERRMASISSMTLVLLGALLLSPAFLLPLETTRWIPVVGVVLFYVGSGLILMAAIRLKQSDATALNLLGSLGGASYSIYLWHLPVGRWGYQFISSTTGIDSELIYFLNATLGACVAGWALNRLIERPVLRVRDALLPHRAHAVDQSGSLAARDDETTLLPSAPIVR